MTLNLTEKSLDKLVGHVKDNLDEIYMFAPHSVSLAIFSLIWPGSSQSLLSLKSRFFLSP